MAAGAPRYEAWLSADEVRGLSDALGDPPEFRATRLEAYERFLRLPLEPNPLYRGYGYFTNVDLTGIDPLASAPPVPLPRALPGSVRIVHDASGTRVQVPGELLDAGVRVVSLTEAWAGADGAARALQRGGEEPTDRLSALATALVNRGYALEVPEGRTEPVRVQDLTVLSAGRQALSVRRAIHAGAGTQLLVSEEVFAMPGAVEHQRLYASTTHVDQGARSKAVYLGVHAPDLATVSIYRRSATTGPESRLAWIWTGLGGFRTKSRNETSLTGRASVVDDLQLFFGAQQQAFDSSVNLTHVATDTHGQSITRGVFRDEARGMSRGLVRIEHEARKTVSFISEHAMLLSKGARSDTIPILEILCRDVKATHSTSVAPVDPERVFYLESRGLTEAESIRAIGEGYLSYVLERAPVAGLRDLMYPALAARWDGRPISWGPEAFPALPALDVRGTEATPEWRFDTKLR